MPDNFGGVQKCLKSLIGVFLPQEENEGIPYRVPLPKSIWIGRRCEGGAMPDDHNAIWLNSQTDQDLTLSPRQREHRVRTTVKIVVDAIEPAHQRG